MMVIYKTINLINGKYYIGKQKSYTKSYLGSGTALKQAIKKYGKNNFKKEILEVCNKEDELKIKELWWLDKFDAVKDKHSYNLVRETSSNNHRSYDNIEYRQKLSESVKKTLSTIESKIRLRKQNGGINNPMYGKHRSKSFKKKMSIIHSGKVVSNSTKEKIRKSKLGVSLPNDVKNKMKISQNKRWDTIIIEMTLDGNYYEFTSRCQFKEFIYNYNQNIPTGRVRGPDPKRIGWKRALKGGYDFIRIIKK